MTKKQLEKYRKEFDEFVANVEKMGGRFLTEDELRYKINGGEGGGGDSENSQEESGSPSVEDEPGEDIAGDPTADGAGETQAGNENEDSSGKSEETAEEDDDKSFWESVCEAVGGVVDAVGDAVSGAAHAVGEFVEDVIDFFTGGSKEDDKTIEEKGSEPNNPDTAVATGKSAEGAGKETVEEKADQNDKNKGDIQDKPNPENEKSSPKIDVDELGAGLRSQLSSPFMSNFAHNSKDDNVSAKLQEMAKQMESEAKSDTDGKYNFHDIVTIDTNSKQGYIEIDDKLTLQGNITIMDEEKSGSVYVHVSDYAFNENSSFFLNAGAKCDVQYENGSFNGFTVEPFLSGTIHIDLK